MAENTDSEIEKCDIYFCGSQQHILNEMVTIPSRPFYNSASLLKLNKINREKYKIYIRKQFTLNRGHLKTQPLIIFLTGLIVIHIMFS